MRSTVQSYNHIRVNASQYTGHESTLTNTCPVQYSNSYCTRFIPNNITRDRTRREQISDNKPRKTKIIPLEQAQSAIRPIQSSNASRSDRAAQKPRPLSRPPNILFPGRASPRTRVPSSFPRPSKHRQRGVFPPSGGGAGEKSSNAISF